MQFISTSLGVECEFCHVEHKFDSDDKHTKQIARKMIEMTLALNRDQFNGRREVTCYSCHRGATDPVGTPPVMTSDAEPPHPQPAPEPAPAGAPAAPTATQILARYVEAVGGDEALHKISSRVARGNITAMGQDAPIEIYMQAPGKRMSITHFPGGESITAFDGTGGWLGSANRSARDMAGAEVDAARLDAEFYLPTRLTAIFTSFRLGHPDTIDGKPVNTVVAVREGLPPVRFYFDQSSGLLLRQVRYADTPIGRNPTEIDYADYREVQGVKLPFRWTLARTNGRFTIQVKDLEQNVAIDAAKFEKPAAPAAK
jgi:photosynthetic reaction center cytochrome c subunit